MPSDELIMAWTWSLRPSCVWSLVFVWVPLYTHLWARMPQRLDEHLCSSKKKRVSLCSCGCPFKGPSQICPRPFDQTIYDLTALDGPWDGRMCAWWETRPTWHSLRKCLWHTCSHIHKHININALGDKKKLQIHSCDDWRPGGHIFYL